MLAITRVTAQDYNFYQLVSYIQKPSLSPAELVQVLQAFRSKLSLKWYENFRNQDPEACLASVWMTLFTLAKHEDAAVRISVFSAIGGLLFALTPFAPNVVRKSFAGAVQKYTETSNASIAIVASFLYICQTISPSDLPDFVTNAPVLHHFGADVSGFIKYIPKFVKLMRPLDLQFHQLLMRSLLSSFGRNPNHDFVKSVVLLVSLNPEPMTKALMEFVMSNDLKPTILALGPQLLESRKIFSLLNGQWLEAFVKESLAVLENENATLSDMEEACGTLAIVVRNSVGEAKQEYVKRIAESRREEYPKHFQRLIVLLPVEFDELKIKEDDNIALKCAKIKAMARYIDEDGPLENIKEVLRMFIELSSMHGDVFTALVNAVRASFRKLLGVEDQVLADLVRLILSAPSKTWVQDSAVLKLTTTIGLDDGTRLIPDFEEIVVGLALKFSLAPHDDLADAAVQSLYQYVNYANIDKILTALMSADLFDAQIARRFVTVLNALADVIDARQLERMIGMVCDVILLYDDAPAIAGQGFLFLSKCGYVNAPDSIHDSCGDWITRMYKWVTQNDSAVSSTLKMPQLPSLITTVETDVVASDILGALSEARPLLYCYEYFIKTAEASDSRETMTFTLELCKLFPLEIVPMSRSQINEKAPTYTNLCNSIATTLQEESSEAAAAVCCDFLVEAPATAREPAIDTVKFLIQNQKITSGSCLFSFFRFMKEVDRGEAQKYREDIEKRLNEIEFALFKIKLGEYSDDEYRILLEKVPFGDFPLDDKDFVSFMDVSSEVVKLTNFDELDDRHMRFFLNHRKIFDSPGFDEYKATHEYRMSRYEAPAPIESKFEVSLSTENVSKDHSALPKLLKKESSFDEIHAWSFCLFSGYVLDSDQFAIILSKVTRKDTAASVLDYAKRLGISIKQQNLDDFLKFNDPSLDEAVAERLSRLASVDPNPEHERQSVKMFLYPHRHLAEIQTNFVKKGKTLINLARTLSKVSLDPQSASRLVEFLFEGVEEIESSKKILAILRIVNQSIAKLGRRSPPELVSLINEKLILMQNTEIPAVHAEIASILSRLFNVTTPELMRICESFDQIAPKSGLFLLAQATAVSKHNIPCSRFVKSGIVDFFTSELPSRRLRLLYACERLMSQTLFFQLFTSLFDNFAKMFAENCQRPFFDGVLAQLASAVAGHVKFDWVRGDFVRRIIPLLFQPPNSPQFSELAMAISLVTHAVGPPIQGYSTFIDLILTTKPTHPRAAYFYSDFVQWLIQNGVDDARKSDIILEDIQVMQKLFLERHTCENAEKLAEALQQQAEGFDPSFMLFGKIAMLPIPLMPLLVLIQKYLRKCSSEDIETCKMWVESVESAYDPDVAKCIRLVLDGKNKEVLPFL